jgi:hypothetical protein
MKAIQVATQGTFPKNIIELMNGSRIFFEFPEKFECDFLSQGDP